MYVLEKYSSPGWEKKFDNKDDLIKELRSHVCLTCRSGYYKYVDEDGAEVEEDNYSDTPVDVVHDGVLFECRDIGILLSTACGCEYGVEIDGKPYHAWENI